MLRTFVKIILFHQRLGIGFLCSWFVLKRLSSLQIMSVPHVLCNKHLIFSKIGAQQIVTNASQEHSYAVVLVHAY